MLSSRGGKATIARTAGNPTQRRVQPTRGHPLRDHRLAKDGARNAVAARTSAAGEVRSGHRGARLPANSRFDLGLGLLPTPRRHYVASPSSRTSTDFADGAKPRPGFGSLCFSHDQVPTRTASRRHIADAPEACDRRAVAKPAGTPHWIPASEGMTISGPESGPCDRPGCDRAVC
jgi:hypothetical protein